MSLLAISSVKVFWQRTEMGLELNSPRMSGLTIGKYVFLDSQNDPVP
jgi:hypothetical protein